MQEPLTLTDDNLDSVLLGDKPIFILVTTGEGVRGDFATAYRKAAAEGRSAVIAQLDPARNPLAAERLGVAPGSPLLIGVYCGEEVVRRSKPWGSDLPLAFEQMDARVREVNPTIIEEQSVNNNQPTANDVPVHVTDATFQQEVIDYDLPVLVDFWAPWCGPCRSVAPVLDKLAKEFAGQIRIAKVNTDENPGLSQAFQIMSIPTIMLIKNRTIVFNQPGALPENAFRDVIKQLIALDVPDPEPRPQQGQ